MKVSIISLATLVWMTACDSTSFSGSSVQRYGSIGGETGKGGPLDPDTPGDPLNPEGSDELVIDEGESKIVLKPMTVKVMRRDKDFGPEHDHTNVNTKFNLVGYERIKSSTLGAEGSPPSQWLACVEGGSSQIEVSFEYDGIEVKPSKETSRGGPIGQRLNDRTILVGFEKKGVNSFSETAYHNNDDLVVLFQCPEGTKLSIKDLCIDNRIPQSSKPENSDLVTDKLSLSGDDMPNGHAPGRRCDGE